MMEDRSVLFTNSKDMVIPTGVPLNMTVDIALLLNCLALAARLTLRRRLEHPGQAS